MKRAKRLLAGFLCASLLGSVIPTELMNATESESNQSTPAEVVTYQFDSEQKVKDFLANEEIYHSFTDDNKPTWDATNNAMKITGKASRATLFVPQTRVDNSYEFPVNGLEGEIQLGYATAYHGALFLYENVNDTTYNGNVVSISKSSQGLTVYFHKVKLTKQQDGIFTGKVAGMASSHRKTYKVSETLMDYLIGEYEREEKDALTARLLELTSEEELKSALNNCLARFKIHFKGNQPYIDLTLAVDGTGYTFSIPTNGTMGTGQKMYGVGGLNSSNINTNYQIQSYLFKELKVHYDITEYYRNGVIKELTDKIENLGVLTSDKKEQLQEIYQSYMSLSEDLQPYVTGIDSIVQALEEFTKGVYFYDDFEGELHWKLAGLTGNETLTPTNTYSSAALENDGDNNGKAFWGIHSSNQDSENQVLWLRKAFDANVNPTSNNNNNKPSVVAITKDVLPNEALVSRVAGKMYLHNWKYGSASYKQNTGISFKYEDEYSWRTVGLSGTSSGKGSIRGIERTSQTKGQLTTLTYTVLEGEGLSSTCDINMGQWVDFELEFDFALGCYTYLVKGLNAEGESVTYKIKLDNATELLGEVALVNATPAMQSFDDISIGLLNGEYASSKIVALPESENVTLEHELQIEEMKQIMKLLPEGEKAKITNDLLEKYQNVLIAYERLLGDYEQTLDASTRITFEDNEAGIEFFEAINGAGFSNWNESDNPKKDSNNKSDTVLEISRNYSNVLEGDNNRAVYKIKKSILDGSKLISNYSGQIYLTTSGTTTIVYDYLSDTQWQGYQLALTSSGKVVVKNVIKDGTGKLKIDSKNSNIVLETTDKVSLDTTGVWIDFNVSYTLIEAQLTIGVVHDGKPYTGQYPTKQSLLDTCATSVGFTCGSTGYIDSIKVNFKSELGYMLATQFVEKYSRLLKLTPVETYLSVTDSNDVEALIRDYNSLSEDVKTYIPLMNKKVDNFSEAYEKIDKNSETAKRDQQLLEKKDKAEDKYTNYVFEDNFDYGLTAWMPARTEIINNGNVSVVNVKDDEVAKAAGFDGAVLKMDGTTTITPKDFLLPNKPQVVSISYRIYRDMSTTTDYNRLHVYGTWTHEDGFYAWSLREKSISLMYGGLFRGVKQTERSTHYLNLSKAFDVTVNFTKTGSWDVILKDDEGHVTQTKSLSGNVRSLAVVGAFGGTTYIDDVKVVYREGNYDVDQENEQITVYYSGNTFQDGGDYVTLYGENLANNVAQVWVSPLKNQQSGIRSMVSQESYDSKGAQLGKYSTDPVEHIFDETSAIFAPIVQTTKDSVKFQLPDTFADGSKPEQAVYSVRLYSANGNSKTIYINTPHIDYVVGSDGDICSPGTDVRVIGKNLAPALDSNHVQAVFVDSDTKEAYDSFVTEVQSIYSLNVHVPDELKVGKTYELWLHSGLGDMTAWSVPVEVKVDKPVRDSWSKTVYNLQTDFGATGVYRQNATPCLVNAFAAIDANGGGILYVPNGTYTIDAELVIPENCRIIGESQDETTFVIRPFNWSYNHLPSAIFNFTTNIEVSNLRIIGSRVSGLFKAHGNKVENVYFKDLYVLLEPEAASVSNGSNALFSWLEESSILQGKVRTETVSQLMVMKDAKNVQLINVNMGETKGFQRPLVEYEEAKQYWQVSDSQFVYHFAAYMSNSTLDNCTFKSGAVGIWGHGCYFQDCDLLSATRNNRELYVADHRSKYSGKMSPYEGAPKGEEEYWYVLDASKLHYLGSQLYVKSGQGTGQTRRVVFTKDDTIDGAKVTVIKLNEPFTVTPNRNSTVILRLARENIYFVNNTYYNGSAGGFYGGCADVVYDGCSFDTVTNIYQNAYLSDVNWYISYKDCSLKHRDMISGIGKTTTNLGLNFVSRRTNHQLCMTIRDCKFDGMFNSFDMEGSNDLLQNVVIQGCEWNDVDYAMRLNDVTYSTGKYTSVDGLLMADNVYNNVDYLWDPDYLDVATALMNTTNLSGSRRAIILDSAMGEIEKGLLGDVNGDKKVDLKDATLIGHYVVGKTLLTESQLFNGDVNGDGRVDMKDASLIKFYVVGKIESFPPETEDSDNVSTDM